jgi:hypothetical protein
MEEIKMKKLMVVLVALMLLGAAALPGVCETNYKQFALGLSPDPLALGINGQYWMNENFGIQADYLDTTLLSTIVGSIIYILDPGYTWNSNFVQLGMNYRPSATGFFQPIYSLALGQSNSTGKSSGGTTSSASIGYFAPGIAVKMGEGAFSTQIGINGIIADKGAAAFPYITFYYNF